MIDAADGNKVYFYHTDQSGSTLALTNTAGEITDVYAYDPYGLLIRHQGESAQPFTYMGAMGAKSEPAQKDLYQMGARFYDAASAAFLSKEPLGLVFNDPVSLSPYYYPRDPLLQGDWTGQEWKKYLVAWGKGFKKIATAGIQKAKDMKGGSKAAVKNTCKNTAQNMTIATNNDQQSGGSKGVLSEFAMAFVPGSSETADLITKMVVWGDVESLTVRDFTDIAGGALRDMFGTPWILIGAVGELMHDLLPSECGEKDGWLKKAAVGTSYVGLAAALMGKFVQESVGTAPTRIGNILLDPATNSRQAGLDLKSRWWIVRASAQFGSWLGQYTAAPINAVDDFISGGKTTTRQPYGSLMNR